MILRVRRHFWLKVGRWWGGSCRRHWWGRGGAVAVDLIRHLLLGQVVSTGERRGSVRVGPPPPSQLEDLPLQSDVVVLPQHVRGEVVGDVGGEKRVDAGVVGEVAREVSAMKLNFYLQHLDILFCNQRHLTMKHLILNQVYSHSEFFKYLQTIIFIKLTINFIKKTPLSLWSLTQTKFPKQLPRLLPSVRSSHYSTSMHN